MRNVVLAAILLAALSAESACAAPSLCGVLSYTIQQGGDAASVEVERISKPASSARTGSASIYMGLISLLLILSLRGS